MKERKKVAKQAQKALDTVSEKRGRGRPPSIPASEIYGRAENYRQFFWEKRLDKKSKQFVRDRPHTWAEQILAATNEDELRKVLDAAPNYVQGQLAGSMPLILSILKERTFPKTTPAQLDYLADSLAGSGRVSSRSSRDICGRERARQRQKSPHTILRKEFYVECSCGYKGPALDDACRKCGAEIPLFQEILWGTDF